MKKKREKEETGIEIKLMKGKKEERGEKKRRHFEDDICHAYLMYDCVEEVCEDVPPFVIF